MDIWIQGCGITNAIGITFKVKEKGIKEQPDKDLADKKIKNDVIVSLIGFFYTI